MTISSLLIVLGQGLPAVWRKFPFSIFAEFLTASWHWSWEVTKILAPLWEPWNQMVQAIKPSIVLGTDFFIQLSMKKSTTIVFLRTPSHHCPPHQDTLYVEKTQATTGNDTTMGSCLIKGDSRKNNYKQGCSPKPTDGSTSFFPRVKDRPDKHYQPQGRQK